MSSYDVYLSSSFKGPTTFRVGGDVVSIEKIHIDVPGITGAIYADLEAQPLDPSRFQVLIQNYQREETSESTTSITISFPGALVAAVSVAAQIAIGGTRHLVKVPCTLPSEVVAGGKYRLFLDSSLPSELINAKLERLSAQEEALEDAMFTVKAALCRLLIPYLTMEALNYPQSEKLSQDKLAQLYGLSLYSLVSALNSELVQSISDQIARYEARYPTALQQMATVQQQKDILRQLLSHIGAKRLKIFYVKMISAQFGIESSGMRIQQRADLFTERVLAKFDLKIEDLQSEESESESDDESGYSAALEDLGQALFQLAIAQGATVEELTSQLGLPESESDSSSEEEYTEPPRRPMIVIQAPSLTPAQIAAQIAAKRPTTSAPQVVQPQPARPQPAPQAPVRRKTSCIVS